MIIREAIVKPCPLTHFIRCHFCGFQDFWEFEDGSIVIWRYKICKVCGHGYRAKRDYNRDWEKQRWKIDVDGIVSILKLDEFPPKPVLYHRCWACYKEYNEALISQPFKYRYLCPECDDDYRKYGRNFFCPKCEYFTKDGKCPPHQRTLNRIVKTFKSDKLIPVCKFYLPKDYEKTKNNNNMDEIPVQN